MTLTPAEKARDLIIKFLPIVVKEDFNKSLKSAKRSACVVCKEFIGHCELHNNPDEKQFWKDVKKELKVYESTI